MPVQFADIKREVKKKMYLLRLSDILNNEKCGNPCNR